MSYKGDIIEESLADRATLETVHVINNTRRASNFRT